MEIVVAVAIFALIATNTVEIVLQGLGLNLLSAEETVANQYASEGLEAAKSIRNQSYALLVDVGSTGVVRSSGLWAFGGTNNQFGKYTRTIAVASVQRDGSGNIVSSGGAVDPNTKKITSTVTWTVRGARQDSVVLSTYLSNWNGEIFAAYKGGIIIYGDGGSTNDTINYRLLDSNTWNWSVPLPVADIDTGSTNRALRASKLYASPSRIEKILLTRHYDGSSQYIYAQVYDGANWGNVILLSSWKASSFMDVQNFDGTYLKNGDFVVSYSDNSVIPKFRVWNGVSWSAQGSMQALGYPPTYIVVKARQDTNEAMAAIYDQGKEVITQYLDGKGYATTNWTNLVSHPTKSNDNSQRLVDFDWSPNSPTKGGLIYVSLTDIKVMSIKIWTADGLGGGSWSTPADTSASAGNIGVMQIVGVPKSDNFLACTKDNSGLPDVTCFKSDLAPAWNSPANNILSVETDHMIEQSYDIGVEQVSNNLALGVFSDKTSNAFPVKYKTYNFGTNSWDVSPVTVNAAPNITGDIKIVRIIPKANSDDMMVLAGDSLLHLYSFVWDGANNTVYTSPAGRAFTQQSTNGANSAETWYDFAWD